MIALAEPARRRRVDRRDRPGRRTPRRRASPADGARRRTASSGYVGRTRGPPSSRTTRACLRIDVAEVARQRAARDLGRARPRARRRSARRRRSTNVMHSSRSARVGARARPPRTRAGRAGGSRARPRWSSGRARTVAHSSWPKYEWRRAGRDDQVVVEAARPMSSSTQLRVEVDRSAPRPSSTSALRWRRSTRRIGAAMSRGLSAAVAT